MVSSAIDTNTVSVFLCLLCPQWAVCDSQALHREEHGHRICSQVHQEAPESGQQTRCKERGDREGSGHPAGTPAPQHRRTARCVREPHRRGADPRTVSHGIIQHDVCGVTRTDAGQATPVLRPKKRRLGGNLDCGSPSDKTWKTSAIKHPNINTQ